MAIEPEKGGKLAHERLQSALPVRAKTRRQPSRLMGPRAALPEQPDRLPLNGHFPFTGGDFVLPCFLLPSVFGASSRELN